MKITDFEYRIEALETKLAFQEHTIDTLNQTIISHELEMAKLREQLRLLLSKMHTAAPSMIASPAEETPPPHY